MQRGATTLEEESKVNRCFDCGGPKPRGQGYNYCTTCKKKRLAKQRRLRNENKRKPCSRCNGKKEGGNSSPYCEECRAWVKTHCTKCGNETKSHHCAYCERTPCPLCGGEKPVGHGRQYCTECQELLRWKNTKLRKLRRKNQHICVDCKHVIHGKGLKYCNECKAKREIRKCIQCSNPARGKHKRLCEACYAKAQLRHKKYHAAYQKMRRDRDPEYYRAKNRKQKASTSPERRRIINESIRIRYRLTKKNVKPLSVEEYRNGNGNGLRSERLPVEPLIPYLREVVPEESQYNRDGRLEALASLADMDASFVRRFMTGEHTTIRLVDADKLCMAMNLTLFEVYENDIHVGRGAALDSTR